MTFLQPYIHTDTLMKTLLDGVLFESDWTNDAAPFWKGVFFIHLYSSMDIQ